MLSKPKITEDRFQYQLLIKDTLQIGQVRTVWLAEQLTVITYAELR